MRGIDTLAEPLPPQRPLEKHVRIEADHFCEHCGYNLFSQPVTRDERLGILIVRCPECGRFLPATGASNAHRVWLQRAATMLLTLWVLALIGVFALSGLALGGLQVAHVELFTRGEHVTPSGRAVKRNWDPVARQLVWVDAATDQPIPPGEPTFSRTFAIDPELRQSPIGIFMLAGLMLGTPLAIGWFWATVLWHVRSWRRFVPLLLPFAAAGVSLVGYQLDEGARGGIDLAMRVVAVAAAAQLFMLLIGTLTGRPVARFVVGLLVPPRPRQALAFLWTADGKAPPALPAREAIRAGPPQ